MIGKIIPAASPLEAISIAVIAVVILIDGPDSLHGAIRAHGGIRGVRSLSKDRFVSHCALRSMALSTFVALGAVATRRGGDRGVGFPTDGVDIVWEGVVGIFAGGVVAVVLHFNVIKLFTRTIPFSSSSMMLLIKINRGMVW